MGKPRGPLARWAIRNLSYPLEAAVAYAFWGFCRVLPLDAASAFGGLLGRTIGPRLRGHRTALRNLEMVMPELSTNARRTIVRGMWDNVGRTLAEYPHLAQILAERIDYVHPERIDALREDGKAGFAAAAHIGNWELFSLVGARFGLNLVGIYRAPNNPYVDRLIARCRGVETVELIPKGPDGARDFMRAVSAGRHIALLVDQKLNDGVAVPFFGRPAMTTPTIGRLAVRLKIPVLMVRGERLDGARFRITAEPPLDVPDTGDRDADAMALMVRMNEVVEGWVRARPEQWLWLHRRWPESR